MSSPLPQTLWQTLKHYFDALPDKAYEAETIDQISSGVTFRGTNLWVLIFAILIASLGLNVNSTAVIIGAMLISPLMGPIIGMGLAIGIGDLSLLKKFYQKLSHRHGHQRAHRDVIFLHFSPHRSSI